jgi:hypothetical protein
MKKITLELTDGQWAKVCQEAFEANQDEIVYFEDTIRALFPEEG